MEVQHTVGLTSTEVAALWSAYMSESMSVCLSKYFDHTNKDVDVKPLIAEYLQVAQARLEKIREYFAEEKCPIPLGYTDEDVNLGAPPLFINLFPLSYVYGSSQLDTLYYSNFATGVARKDIRLFFTECATASLDMYNKSVDLMLSKGVYDRPAFISYPDHIKFMEKKETFLSKWFEPHRPLNVLEMADIFFNIERNYFGVIFLTGFIQVVKDEEIKKYLVRGKNLANEEIEYLNELLIKEELLGNIMVNTEVSASTISPFSDKLILGIVTMTNSAAIKHIGRAISTASRVDLAAHYSKFLVKVMQYGKAGMELMIERKWMEEPPHAPDRKKLAHV